MRERDTHTHTKKSKRQNGCKPTTTTTTTTDCYTFACIIENNVQSHFHNQILPTNGDDDFSSVSRHVEPDHVFFGWLSIKTLARNDFSGDCKQTNEGKRERERPSERRMEKSHWLGVSFLRIIQLKSLWGCNEFHGITSHHCNLIFDWIRTKNPNPLNWSLRISFFSCAPAFIPYKYTCVRAKISLFEYEKLFDAPGKWLKSLTISFHYWSRVECLIA